MIDDVPLDRVEGVRRRARKEIKAAIGGSVTTSLIGTTTICVVSHLVLDAKTDEQQRAEMRAAVDRVGDLGLERPAHHPPASCRRTWSQVRAGGADSSSGPQ